ncbi:MAG TPA: tRNA dihydrouridine synthase DusB [Kofleriaceae bacterium]|nr:tRNA dihydrouridine synthase DusB [Kofleriaceae bacterium]
MRVGEIEIEVPVLLAPMAAVTDLPFRTVCEELGVGLTITEFLSAHAITAGDPKTISKMTPSLNGRRFGVQIFGREPWRMVEAARTAVSIGASLVDINMGCPAKRVVAGACGSALMREPALAQDLVRAVVSAVPANVPVTVKHRAGWDDLHRNAPEFACAMVEAGASMITVHGRTRTQGFSGSADRTIIREVRAAVPREVPVVGNGDVVTVEDYLRMRDETGCDAVMIGRGAMGNPWLFARLRELASGRPDPGPPSLAERRDVFLRHVQLLEELRRGPKLIHEVRKASAWYVKGLQGANQLRQRVWREERPEAAAGAVLDHLERLAA